MKTVFVVEWQSNIGSEQMCLQSFRKEREKGKMKEDIVNERPVIEDAQSIQIKEALDNTQEGILEDIPDEWLEEVAGGTLGSAVLNTSHRIARIGREDVQMAAVSISSATVSIGGIGLLTWAQSMEGQNVT